MPKRKRAAAEDTEEKDMQTRSKTRRKAKEEEPEGEAEENEDDGDAGDDDIVNTKDPEVLDDKTAKELYDAEWDGAEFISKLGFDPATTTSKEEYPKVFSELASYLMNNFLLFSNGRPFRFAEIEFYCKNDVHDDVFTHCDELQQTNCQWYFHRSSGQSYKAGTYKGLDLTFGAANKGYGGILIRALKDLKTGKYIEGSCMCVDSILRVAGAKDIPALVGNSSFNLDVTKGGVLCVKPAHKNITKHDIHSSARVGLTLKKTDGDRPFFIMKPYRFMNYPKLVKKGKILLILGLYHSGKTADEVAAVLGGKKTAALQKNLTTYDKAKANKPEASKFQGKALKNDDLCELYAICG